MEFAVRAIMEEDLETIRNWRMSPDITRYMDTDPVLTPQGQAEWLKRIRRSGHRKYWMITVDGTPAGVINLADMDYENKTTSWGYYVGEKKLRSMQLALSLELSLYAYVFGTLQFQEVRGRVFSENREVIRIHRMCGCRTETVKGDIVIKNGIPHEITRISITRNEWEQNRRYYRFTPVDFGGGGKHRISFTRRMRQVAV